MNEERVKRLRAEIRYLERQLSKELGYSSAGQMRKSAKKAVIKTATIKAWKHAQEK